MLLYFDRASMAHSLGVTKRVLKEAGLQVLPSGTVHKPKVGFFRAALDTWLNAQLDALLVIAFAPRTLPISSS
jgi:hypothetical protein